MGAAAELERLAHPLAPTAVPTSATPSFSPGESKRSHHIHGANISEGGLTGGANRNLLDYMQVCFDPGGAAVLSFADDHNDYTVRHTRQTSGPSINGGNIPVPIPRGSVARPPGRCATSCSGSIRRTGHQFVHGRCDHAGLNFIWNPRSVRHPNVRVFIGGQST